MALTRADVVSLTTLEPPADGEYFARHLLRLVSMLQQLLEADNCSFWSYVDQGKTLIPQCHSNDVSGFSKVNSLHSSQCPQLFSYLQQHDLLSANAARLHPATSALNSVCLIEQGIHSLLLFSINKDGIPWAMIALEYWQPHQWQPDQILQAQRLNGSATQQLWSAQKREQHLQQKLFSHVIEHSDMRLLVAEVDSLEVVYVNNVQGRHNALASGSILGRSVKRLPIFEQQPQLADQILGECLKYGRSSGELALQLADGEQRYFRINLTKVTAYGRDYLLILGDDISAQYRRQAELELRVWRCALTGVFNRARFMDQLSRGEIGAMLLIDINAFRAFNDAHGDRAGDFVLQEVARRLNSFSANGDSVYRIGADEFVLVCDAAELNNGAEGLPDNIAKRLRAEMLFGADLFAIDVSVAGLDTSILDDQITPLAALDLAMNEARACRAFQRYDLRLQSEFLEQARLEVELRSAVSRKQFQLHYQPLVDVVSGQVTGAEALIRWQHPRLGLVFPGTFIDIAERSNLIDGIGQWVFESALYQLYLWQRRWPNLTMHVNVSVKQLLNDEFFQICWEQLNRYRIKPGSLVLEITENTLMEDVILTGKLCDQLGELGLGFAIDDFGTGYSSMSYLKQLPVQKLKIDRTFVADLEHSRESRQIVPAIIAMGKALNLSITAEGVENRYQEQFLRTHLCDEMQGFYYSRAIPVADFEQRLQRVSHSSV